MKKNEVYTELSIQIGVLEAKVDKLLDLLLPLQNTIDPMKIDIQLPDGFTGQDLAKAVAGFVTLSNEEFDKEYK